MVTTSNPHVTEHRADPVTGRRQYRTRMVGSHGPDAWSQWVDVHCDHAPARVTFLYVNDGLRLATEWCRCGASREVERHGEPSVTLGPWVAAG